MNPPFRPYSDPRDQWSTEFLRPGVWRARIHWLAWQDGDWSRTNINWTWDISDMFNYVDIMDYISTWIISLIILISQVNDYISGYHWISINFLYYVDIHWWMISYYISSFGVFPLIVKALHLRILEPHLYPPWIQRRAYVQNASAMLCVLHVNCCYRLNKKLINQNPDLPWKKTPSIFAPWSTLW